MKFVVRTNPVTTPDFYGSLLVKNPQQVGTVASGNTHNTLDLEIDASKTSSVYTDNGKVLPLSISKQSYIIYK